MPLSTAAKVAIAAAAVGGAAWYRGRTKRGRKQKKITPGEGVPTCLETTWAPRQALISDIYSNLNDAARATADQFFGFNLTPQAQGILFEHLSEIYVEDLEVPAMVSAPTALAEAAPCDWDSGEWSQTMAEAMASTEALAMIVLADIQDVVIAFEMPPVEIVADPEADQCVAAVYEVAAGPIHPEIGPELSEPAKAIADDETFHLTDAAQGAAFLHLAQMAANDVGTWLTTPILATLRAISPGCAWERKDHYTQHMADIWDDVENLKEIIEVDIGPSPGE